MDNFKDTNDAINKTNELYHEGKEKISNAYYTAKEKTEEIIDEVKDTASNMYQEGKNKINDIENTVSDYTDEFIQIVKDKPLTSLLIAGGVGFLLAKFLKK